MRTTAITFPIVVAFLLAAGPALAQPAPAPEGKPDPNAVTMPETGQTQAEREEQQMNRLPGVIGIKEPSKELSAWDKWTNFIDREIDKIGTMDLYGVTAQLPRGYFKFKWDWSSLTATQRYNSEHNAGPALHITPTIKQNWKDPKTGKTVQKDVPLLDLDFGLNGKGGGHTIQMSYGILGNFDWYIEIPIQYMEVSFNPKLNPIEELDPTTGLLVPSQNQLHPQLASFLGYTNRSGIDGWGFLKRLMPQLGRPLPAERFKGAWLLGDINTGFSWNWFRNSRMSAALTPRVYFPTGTLADPNASLFYGTGPQLDTGVGGWAVGFTQGYDVRIYKYLYWVDILFSTEFTTSYGFSQQRKYPTNFLAAGAAAAMLDPSGNMFPDLSNLGKNGNNTFTYVPGWGLSWTAQLQFQLAILGLGVMYGVSHSQEPEIRGDPGFIAMSKSLQLLGTSTYQAIGLSASLTLLPLYIPAEVMFSWKKMVDGYNAIIFDNYFSLTAQFFVPVWPMQAIPFPEQAFPEWKPPAEEIGRSSWEWWGKEAPHHLYDLPEDMGQPKPEPAPATNPDLQKEGI